MRLLILLLLPFSVLADVTITVTPSAPVHGVEIGQYRVYYGTESGVYSDSIDLLEDNPEITVSIPDGDYYAVASAISTEGNESGLTSEVLFRVVNGVKVKSPNVPGLVIQ